MPSQYGSGGSAAATVAHAHTNAAGDGGALTLTTSLLGVGLLGSFVSYRRPVLVYTSSTTITAENNTPVAGQTGILFPDNVYRVEANAARRVLDLSRVAVLGGTNQSGLRTGTVANNTWYSVYAVKCTNNATDFALVADVVPPIQANFATLNTNFGTGGWVYLGSIPYGNNGAAPSVIIPFVMTGNRISLYGVATTTGGTPMAGYFLAQANGTSLTWTYAAGMTAGTIPDTIKQGVLSCFESSATIKVRNAAASTYLERNDANTLQVIRLSTHLTEGIQVIVGSSVEIAIILSEYDDLVLGVGSNPQL